MSSDSKYEQITRGEILRILTSIIELLGAPNSHAKTVANSLVSAEEAGHTSHGIIRILEYAQYVKKGKLKPSAIPSIVRDDKAVTVIDGNEGWGQVSSTFAVELLISKTREFGLASVAIRNSNYVGRIGEYSEILAANGLISIIWCNTSPAVAAYGGKSRLFGTNPFAAGIPTSSKPLIIDFATAGTAEGKLRVSRAKNEAVAPGLLIDVNGNPSVDPEDFYSGGSLLPFGGHKGYCLNLMIELLGGALSGNHPNMNAAYTGGNGLLMIGIDPEKFLSIEEYFDDISEASEKIRSVSPANIERPVLLPGDVENISRAENSQSITVFSDTWAEVLGLLGGANKL